MYKLYISAPAENIFSLDIVTLFGSRILWASLIMSYVLSYKCCFISFLSVCVFKDTIISHMKGHPGKMMMKITK